MLTRSIRLLRSFRFCAAKEAAEHEEITKK